MANERPHYGPPEAFHAPRYTGIRTFARCPASTDWENADVAVLGVPFDTATSMRPGPRFGPAAIRDQSQLIRPWHTAHAIDVFATLSVIDGGDIGITPGNAERTAGQIDEGLRPVIDAGATPLVLGGDHSIVLGELRAHARAHGPVGVVLLDAHADTWEAYYGERYFHGTPFKRALEEGLIDPHRSLLAGMRGPLYAASDLDEPRSWGFEIVPCDELRTWTPAEYGARVRERIGDGAGLPVVRHRRPRPGLRAGHRDARDRRAAAPRGGRLPARARRHPVHRLRRRRGLAAVRRAGPGDRAHRRVDRLRAARACGGRRRGRADAPRYVRASSARRHAGTPRLVPRIIACRGDALPLPDTHGLAVPVRARGARAAPARRALHRRPGPVPEAEPARGGGPERPAPRPAARDRR